MSKFNPTTQGGGGILDRALPDLPTGPQAPAPAAPTPDTSVIGSLIGTSVDTGSPESAPESTPYISTTFEQELEREEQREREAIQPLKQRYEDTERVDRWKTQQKTADGAPDNGSGGLFERTRKVADDFEAGRVAVSINPQGESHAAFKAGGVDSLIETERGRKPGSLTAAINASGAATNTVGPTGRVTATVDPSYIQIGAAVTENVFAELAFGEGDVDIPDAAAAQAEGRQPLVSKAQNNQALGQEIHREYMRRKNSAAGVPVDQYQDLSPQEATTLGDAFKEMWAESLGPSMVKRITDPESKQVFYQLTDPGVNALKKSAQARKRLFPKTNIRPQKTPTGQLRGEQRRAVKKVTGKVGTPADMDTLVKATNNLNQVPNVVDKQRMRILFSTILPALAGKPDDMGSTINNFGADKMAKFAAQEAAARKEGDTTYSAEENMQALQDSIAQAVRSVAMERDAANYFTYTIQAFNGRIAPQQTFFDATSSKAVRFVTRNAVPAVATPGSRVEKNLRQMYAMMLVKGADALLPSGRERELDRNTLQLYKWGQRLEQVLEQSMTDAEAEVVAQAIERGIPLTDPQFPEVRGLQLDPDGDAELIAAIKSKGEDGPHFIDGLIDFKNYWEAKRAGRPHHSYFNAYMDGKTNGIASNGIQMGSKEVALATGVIRNNKKQLLDDGDIRDQLKRELLHNVENNGFDGTVENDVAMNDVATAVYSYRDLNKATTMTFGYGKELGSFKKDISETVSFLEEISRGDDQALIEKHGLETFANSLAALDEEFENGRGELVETLLNLYNESLAGVLSDEAIDSRALMRSAATLHAVANKLFSIKSYTGFDLNLGGEETLGWEGAEHTDYQLYISEADNPVTIDVDQGFAQTQDQFEAGVVDQARARRGVVAADTGSSRLLVEEYIIRSGQGTKPDTVHYDYVDNQGKKIEVKTIKPGDLEKGMAHEQQFVDHMQRAEQSGQNPDFVEIWVQDNTGRLQQGNQVTIQRLGRIPFKKYMENLVDNSTVPGYKAKKKDGSLRYPWAIPNVKDLMEPVRTVSKRTAAAYKTEPTAAAIRWRTDKEGNLEAEPGGDAYGGSLPGPVQSLDAATVAMTVTGKSWDKLRSASGGNPYIHTIFDAFKVDAMGYDVVLDEVNKNWLQASMEWSYLEQTYDATKTKMKEFWDEMGQVPNDQKIDISMSGQHRMMGYLLDPTVSESGKFPTRLKNKLEKLLPRKKGEDGEAMSDKAFEATLRITKALKAAGFNIYDPNTATAGHLKVFMKALTHELQLSSRMSAMIDHTNAKKKELKKEIDKSGPVYQYYAH